MFELEVPLDLKLFAWLNPKRIEHEWEGRLVVVLCSAGSLLIKGENLLEISKFLMVVSDIIDNERRKLIMNWGVCENFHCSQH